MSEGGLNNNLLGVDTTAGLPDRRKSGGNGVFIVANNSRKIIRQSRSYSTICLAKENNNIDPNEVNSKGLLQLDQLTKNNLNNNNFINYNILKLISDIDILKIAYSEIKSNPGNMTKGTNNETLDGISEKYLVKLSQDLATGKFKFSPTRRVLIPKDKGGFSYNYRPLSIGNPREKIVQKAMAIVLERIFDPHMSPSSHGFRPNKSCISAI